MNAIDLLLLFIVFVSLWRGWYKGLLAGTADLLSLLGSLLTAFLIYQPLAAWLQKQFPSVGSWSTVIAFLGLIFLMHLLLSNLLYRIIVQPTEHLKDRTFNKVMGLIPGFFNGLLNAALVAALLVLLPLSSTVKSTARDSKAIQLLSGQIEWFDEKLAPVFDAALKNTLRTKPLYPEANATVKLDFTVSDPRFRQDLEKEMLALVNAERTKRKIPALEWDQSLLPAARLHATDMFARGYFSHYSPEKKTVADRLRQTKVRYLVAGENLALAPTLAIAHDGLMKSPGHRANILNKTYGRMAIGVADGGLHGLMITQVFKN